MLKAMLLVVPLLIFGVALGLPMFWAALAAIGVAAFILVDSAKGDDE